VSIFASSLQTVDEAVDDDTYDEDQGGFVIDTAGVFCAVISDQDSDLYIDKSDLMRELVSDDDTDSEDESQLYKNMIELSIVRTSLHAPDLKEFSYEVVSAELDRYLDGPQFTIVYSTHTALERHWRCTTFCYAATIHLFPARMDSRSPSGVHHYRPRSDRRAE
jgi:hypothetical protein